MPLAEWSADGAQAIGPSSEPCDRKPLRQAVRGVQRLHAPIRSEWLKRMVRRPRTGAPDPWFARPSWELFAMNRTANTSGRLGPAAAMASARVLAGLVLGLILALPAQPVRADALGELREALLKLRGAAPLRATVTARINATVTDDADKTRVETGSASLVMEDGPQGLRLTFSPEMLARSLAERVAQHKDDKAPAPTSTAMAELDVAELAGMAQAAPELLRWLELARLRSERKDTWNGAPVRVLSLDLAIDRESKHVRSASSTVDVWIDAQGRPLASKAVSSVSGRVMMVISFEARSTDDRVYAVVGDRLIVTRRETSNSGSGMGQSGDSKTLITLAPGG